MGLFDTIDVWPRGELLCAAGHPLEQLQTKDLDCEMQHYVVADRVLLRVAGEETQAVVQEQGRPVLRRTAALEPERRTATIVAYTHCSACLPVLYVSPVGVGDQVQQREPWAEWQLSFVDGRLVGLEPCKLETRDDVRAVLRAQGLDVLDDDERMARMHFARRSR